MTFYQDEEDFKDETLDDHETLEELDVDEDGHVVEGNRRNRRIFDEDEEDFEDSNPEVYGYDDEDDSIDEEDE